MVIVEATSSFGKLVKCSPLSRFSRVDLGDMNLQATDDWVSGTTIGTPNEFTASTGAPVVVALPVMLVTISALPIVPVTGKYWRYPDPTA